MCDSAVAYNLPPPPDKSGILQWQHEKFSEIGWDYEKAVAKINTILPTFGIRETWRDDIIRNASQHWIAMAAIPEESVQRILEIGTFSGNTTALLAVLFPQSEIVTCDLPDDSQQYISTYGRLDIRKKYTLEQERERNITAKNITFIQKNSFLLPRYTQGEFDLIWIDGGHEYPDVAFDICNCFYMLSTHGIMLCDDIVIPDNMTKDSRNDTFNVFSPLVRDSIVNVKYIMKRLNVGIKQHLSGKMIAVVKKGI
jgi:predicted O-methyltransferase YrrM